MTYPTDEETFAARNSPEWIKEGHLNSIQQFLKRIQDFLGYGGRLHDKAGLVLPVGGMIEWPDIAAPDGWLLCDGHVYNGTVDAYVDLYARIGTKYGTPGAPLFNVPDRRGFYTRGCVNVPIKSFAPASVHTDTDRIDILEGLYNRIGFPVRFTTDDTLPAPFVINTTYYLIRAGAEDLEFATTWQNAIDGVKIDITTVGSGTSYLHPYVEEDAGSRIISAKGGNSGADLGSYQEDALQGHRHKVENHVPNYIEAKSDRAAGAQSRIGPSGVWGDTRYNARDIYDDPSYGVAKVAIETRVRNVNVNYIIKR